VSAYPTDAGDHTGPRCITVVTLLGGQRGEFEEGTGGIDDSVDPLAHRKLAAFALPLVGARTAAGAGVFEAFTQFSEEP
jgi:hypothetical protein